MPGTATTDRTGPGTVAWGVTDAVGADAVLGPATLLATTVNVYPVPLDSPVMVHERADAATEQSPDGFPVTV